MCASTRNKQSYENCYSILSTESANTDKKYFAFIRLYDCVYKNPLCAPAILDHGIKFVSDDVKSTHMKFNHASINTNLTDMFYGLTATGGDCSLKFETCESEGKTGNDFMDACNPKKSKFGVFYAELSKKDYETLKSVLSLGKQECKYDILLNAKMAGYFLVQKVKKLFTKSSEALNLKDASWKGQVCSTFCAFCLKQLSKFKDKISDEKIYDPDAIVNNLGLKLLCTGIWADYSTDIEKSISKHPEMKEYWSKKIK